MMAVPPFPSFCGLCACTYSRSDNPTSLKMFLTFLVRDKERSRSLCSMWRVIGAYMTKTGRPNLTALDSRVKAHYSSLLDKHGVEEHPRTAATPRMLKLSVGSGESTQPTIVDKYCPRPIIAARTKLDIGCLVPADLDESVGSDQLLRLMPVT